MNKILPHYPQNCSTIASCSKNLENVLANQLVTYLLVTAIIVSSVVAMHSVVSNTKSSFTTPSSNVNSVWGMDLNLKRRQ